MDVCVDPVIEFRRLIEASLLIDLLENLVEAFLVESQNTQRRKQFVQRFDGVTDREDFLVEIRLPCMRDSSGGSIWMSFYILSILVESKGVRLRFENGNIVLCPAFWTLVFRIERLY